MEDMKYTFNIPVGDWSDDGHGKCEYFTAKSNKSVEDVREIHFQIKEATGFDIESFCGEDGNNFCEYDDYESLKNLGFDFKQEGLEDDDDNAVIYPKGFAEIWVFLLMKTDNTLKLEFINNDIANLSFYGFDEKGRHISASGYGCFY